MNKVMATIRKMHTEIQAMKAPRTAHRPTLLHKVKKSFRGLLNLCCKLSCSTFLFTFSNNFIIFAQLLFPAGRNSMYWLLSTKS